MDAAVQMAPDAGSPPATSSAAGSSFDAGVAEPSDSGSGQASDSGSASGDAEPDPDAGMADTGMSDAGLGFPIGL